MKPSEKTINESKIINVNSFINNLNKLIIVKQLYFKDSFNQEDNENN